MRTLVIDHPLVTHKLTALRDAATDTATFRSLTAELVTLLSRRAGRTAAGREGIRGPAGRSALGPGGHRDGR